MTHRNHNVLGSYCWDCKIRTNNSTPGFEKRTAKNDGPRINYMKGSVVWADGTRDMRDSGGGSERLACSVCRRHDCTKPVHEEKYKIVASSVAKNWDKFNPVI